ncbi:hypothetical protein NVP1038O_04 [Vibrio phage 1.038.O._10N.286.51.C2]|nr:hypothetical protein NVP1038O_04 [Vibrio phage 1.038.O._10N.286.51.C2]
MSEFRVGLYFIYESHSGSQVVDRVSSYQFDGEQGPWVEAHEKVAPLGKIFVLTCKCGSNDWNDNGRDINEYECGGCGQFISTCEYGAIQAERNKLRGGND